MSFEQKVLDWIQRTRSDKYAFGKIQPLTYIEAWDMPFLEGSVIKYISRHLACREGVFNPPDEKDLLKAVHYIRQIWERDHGSQLGKMPDVQPTGRDEKRDDCKTSAGGGTNAGPCDVSRPEPGLGREPNAPPVCRFCRQAIEPDTLCFVMAEGDLVHHKCSQVLHRR